MKISLSPLVFVTNLFILLQIVSMVATNNKIILPTITFDIVFLSLMAFIIMTVRKINIYLLFFLFYIAFLALFWIYFNDENIPMYHYFLSIKPIAYLCLLLLSIDNTKKLFYTKPVFIYYFIALYLISILIQYFFTFNLRGMRPFVFQENNFEYVLFFVAVLKTFNKYPKLFLTSLIPIWGSISASVSIAFLYFYNRIFTFHGFVFLIMLMATILYAFLEIRSVSILNVDRVEFILIAYENLSSNLLNLLFGNFKPTVLNDSSCAFLSFYKVDSYPGCYSVLLHLVWLRILLDFGIITVALILLIFLIYSLRNFQNFLICGLLFLNGLSVSSFTAGIICIAVVLFYYLDIRKSDI